MTELLVTGLTWKPFRIAFAEDFRTATTGKSAARFREGVIVRLASDGGVGGIGEASPLAERGGGSVDDVVRLLAEIAPTVVGMNDGELRELAADLIARPGGAATACALDVAMLDALARAAQQPLARLLAEREGGRHATSVAVNATIGQGDSGAAAKAAARAQANGYRVAKIKVGLMADVDAELDRMAAIRSAVGPAMRLRIDANGAWDATTAVSILRRLEPLDIEWVEQPVPAGDVDGLKAVRSGTSIAVAVDESVGTLDDVARLLAAEAADVYVLKPMTLGGLRPARRAALLAQSGGARAVVTTTIDSGVATAAALHLAASLPGDLPACGLATAALLEDDLLVAPLEVREGRMSLPDGAGLGVDLRPAHTPG